MKSISSCFTKILISSPNLLRWFRVTCPLSLDKTLTDYTGSIIGMETPTNNPLPTLMGFITHITALVFAVFCILAVNSMKARIF